MGCPLLALSRLFRRGFYATRKIARRSRGYWPRVYQFPFSAAFNADVISSDFADFINLTIAFDINENWIGAFNAIW